MGRSAIHDPMLNMMNKIWRLRRPESFEILDGLLLGDASIPKERAPYFTFAQAGEDRREFVLYVVGILEPVFPCRTNFTTRGSDGVYVSTMWTSVSDYWREQRRRFYPDGKKVIPKDVSVTPSSVLMLYLCDGSLGRSRGSSPWAEIALCDFSFEEIEFFGNTLKGRSFSDYRIKPTKVMSIPGRKKGSNVDRFIRFISKGGPVPPCMLHLFKGYEDYVEVLRK